MDGLARHSVRGLDIAHADVFAARWTRRATGQDSNLLLAIVNGVAATIDAALDHFNSDQFALQALGLDLRHGPAFSGLVVAARS